MKLAFLDLEGDLFPAVWRVAQEGHRVRYWLDDDDERVQRIGRGLVDRAESLDALIAFRPDVAVAYQTPRGARTLARAGIPTWGATAESVELEKDRMLAAKLAGKLGLAVPRTERFGSLAAARRFVERNAETQWVLKAEGGADAETASTHPTDSLVQLLTLLDYEASRGNTSFVLQERVRGVEVSTEGWFDYRRGWLQPINSTMEQKRAHADDLGPMCGSSGSIVWYWPDAEPLLWQQLLAPWTAHLTSIRYVGPFDINAIVPYDGDAHVPWFLEITPRFGWSAFDALMAGLSGDLGEFFVALGHGEASRLPPFRHPIMGAVRVSVPAAENVPIVAPYHAVRHFNPVAVWRDKTTLRTTGAGEESGYVSIFEITDADSSVGAVMDAIYGRHIPRILAPDNLDYRRDIGRRAVGDMSLLEAWGHRIFPSETLIDERDQRPAEPLLRLARSA